MQKLMVVGIVYVAVLVAWWLYLEYDTKQFRERLPEPPVSRTLREQQIPAALVSVRDSTEERSGSTYENAQTPTVPLATEHTKTQRADTGFEGEPLDTAPETVDTGLSPELEALFTAYDPIYRELEKVISVLSPLLDRHRRGSHRIREILSEALPNSVDGPERKALYAEFEEIHTWKKNVREETFELQDERKRLSHERSVLLTEHGISSWQEFDRRHGEAYTAWRSEQ